jgi:hypothetical protein
VPPHHLKPVLSTCMKRIVKSARQSSFYWPTRSALYYVSGVGDKITICTYSHLKFSFAFSCFLINHHASTHEFDHRVRSTAALPGPLHHRAKMMNRTLCCIGDADRCEHRDYLSLCSMAWEKQQRATEGQNCEMPTTDLSKVSTAWTVERVCNGICVYSNGLNLCSTC